MRQKQMVRTVLTILMYAGVVVVLFPYFLGLHSINVMYLLIGGGAAVVFGLLRCYLTEGDCGKLPQHSRDW